jgi:hypothetical protein
MLFLNIGGEMNQEKIQALGQLTRLIMPVMENFSWYFIKIYLLQRIQLTASITGNSDQIVRRRYEENRMDIFLDNMNQLVQNHEAVYPKSDMSAHEVIEFLETRIAAIATVAIIFHKHQALLNPMQIMQIATQSKMFTIEINKLKPLLNDGSMILKKQNNSYLFSSHVRYVKGLLDVGDLILQVGCGQQELENIRFNSNFITEEAGSSGGEFHLKKCSGVLILANLKNLSLIQVEKSPKLHLIIKGSNFSKLQIEGELESLKIESTQIEELEVCATLDELSIEKQSFVTKTKISRSIIGRLLVNQSRTAIQIINSPIIHHISLKNKSLSTLYCEKSEIGDLFSDCFLYGIFSNASLKRIDLRKTEFAYLYFDVHSRLTEENFITPSHTHQMIKKNGKLLAFYATQDIEIEEPAILDLTGNEEKSPLIESMSGCLTGDEVVHHWEMVTCFEADGLNYARDKKSLISKQIIQLGIVLLTHQIDPAHTIWRQLCWHYSAIHRIQENSDQLTQSLLRTAYLKKIKYRLEMDYSCYAKILTGLSIRTQLFSLLNVDQIIDLPIYPNELRSQYQEDKKIIYDLLQAIEFISLYETSDLFYSRKKERLKLTLLEMIESTVNNNQLSIAEKRDLITNRIDDALVLNQKLLQKGSMMRFLVENSLSALKNIEKLNMTSQQVVLRQCKSLCDHYKPIFSWFGVGKKKLACLRYLSFFITDRNFSLTNRLRSIKHKINYLMQLVEETSHETRQETIMRSFPLWETQSRPGRGYQFILNCLKSTIETYEFNNKDNINYLLQSEIARPLVQQSQARFFKTHQLIGQTRAQSRLTNTH